MPRQNNMLQVVAVFSVVLVFAMLAFPGEAGAANYVPTLLAPSDAATAIPPDGTEFSWSVSATPDSFIVDWALDDTFASDKLLFSYSVSALKYNLRGLPGSTTIYWRVTSVITGIKYSSAAFSFTTGSDSEASKLVRMLYDDFSSWNSSTWTITQSSSMLYYDSGNGCVHGRYWSYSGVTSYLNTTLNMPATACVLTFKWCHSGVYYSSYPNDALYVEYSLDNNTFSRFVSLSASTFDSGSSGITTIGTYKTHTVDMPSGTRGKKIYLRWVFQSGYGPDVFVDDIEISYMKLDRKLNVSSDYGTPVPDGETISEAGTMVTATVDLHAFAPGVLDKRFYCSGWTGTGSVPVSGVGNTAKFLLYRTSALTWTWLTEYRVIVASTNSYGSPNPSGTNYYLNGTAVTFTAEKVQDIGDPDQRWGLLKWTGSGSCSGTGTEASVSFKITAVSNLTWTYKIQYRLTMASAYAASGFDPPLGDNWIFDASVVLATAPDFIDLGGGFGFMWAGYSAPSSVIPDQVRPVVISVRSTMTFTWLWSTAYNLAVITPFGSITGNQPGWYLAGTSISTAVTEIAPTTNDDTRWHATGWSATGSVGNGAGYAVPTFLLNSPTAINWIWIREFYCEFTSNAGSVLPSSGWFAENASLPISAILPGDTSDTRYFFNAWQGQGRGSYSGTNLSDSVSILEPISERAVWNIEYKLTVLVLTGGTLAPDPSNWYSEGAPVTINAVPPTASSGERYRANWLGTGIGSVTLPRSDVSPSSVIVTMGGPIVERVQWNIQYSLTIENSTGNGFCWPNVGTHWYFGGDTADGYSSYGFETVVCTGYTATGAVSGDSKPYFSFSIDTPTTISWTWGDRPASATNVWGGMSKLGDDHAETVALVRLPSGQLVTYYAVPELGKLAKSVLDNGTWTTSTVLSDTGTIVYLDAAAGSDGIVSIVFSREDPVGLVYLEDDFSAKTDGGTFALGNSGTRCSVARNGSDVYISYFDVADASLKVAHSILGGWDVQTIDNSEGAGFFNAIAIPAYNELPVVVFARSGGTKGLFFATYDGEMWNTETIVPQFAGFFCSIALDKGGVPFVAYQSLDAPGASSLHCIRYNGEGWLDELVDNQGDTGYYTSIVLDSAGYAHISYSDRVNLLYAKQTAAGWEKSILVQGGVDGSTDITLISGKPAIAFIHSGKPGYIDATGTATDGGDGGGGTVTPTSGGGGGCFIATAAFGTMASDAVGRLTSARDELVTASESGIQLVNLYYAVSPAAAVALAKSESARKLMALLLP